MYFKKLKHQIAEIGLIFTDSLKEIFDFKLSFVQSDRSSSRDPFKDFDKIQHWNTFNILSLKCPRRHMNLENQSGLSFKSPKRYTTSSDSEIADWSDLVLS